MLDGQVGDEIERHARRMRDGFVFLINERGQTVEKLFGADDDLVMVGLEGLRHRARVFQLIRIAFSESDGESFDRLFHKAAHDGRDRARINASGEKHSERHIRHQMRLDAFTEDLAEALYVLRFTQGFIRSCEAQVPITLDFDLSVAPDQCVAGQQSPYAMKERLFARGITVRRVIGERVVIQLRPGRARLNQGLDLRREVERPVILHGVVQGLDAEPVTRDHEPPPPAVPDRVGEHPAQPLDALRAELLVEVDNRLGVRRAAINVSALFQHRAQFAVVIYLAVENYPDRVVFIRHRLAAPAQIDYGQSPVTEPDRFVYQDAGVVRTAMGERIPHCDKPRLVHPPAQLIWYGDAADATHNSTSSP